MNRSLITWLIILPFWLGTGLLTILPSFPGMVSSASLYSDPTIVTFPLPVPIGRAKIAGELAMDAGAWLS